MKRSWQLNAALVKKSPNDGTALYLLSQAYAREGEFAAGKEGRALGAVAAVPGNGEGHFWLAECERHLNEAAEAEAEYRLYLKQTNFNSGALGNANYYVLGFLLGMGKKHHAAEQDIWREQQGQANLGICDCEYMQKRYDAATPFCEKALDPDAIGSLGELPPGRDLHRAGKRSCASGQYCLSQYSKHGRSSEGCQSQIRKCRNRESGYR